MYQVLLSSTFTEDSVIFYANIFNLHSFLVLETIKINWKVLIISFELQFVLCYTSIAVSGESYSNTDLDTFID